MSTNAAWRLPSKGSGVSSLKKVIEERPIPLPHQYLVRIRAVSLNYRDIAAVNGQFYPAETKDDVIPCADMAGEIAAVGASVSRFKVGDRVTAMMGAFEVREGKPEIVLLGGTVDGALQEYRIFDEESLLSAPSNLTFEEISCFPIAGLTAWNALFGPGVALRPGQTALFQGTGVVSIFGLQIARLAGARTIITSSSDKKLELAKSLGVTHVINYKTIPDWGAEVKRITKGIGAHHVFDNVGISEIEQCFGAVAQGGVISNIGFLGGPTAENLVNPTLLTLWTRSMMRGIAVGTKEQFEELLAFAEIHTLRPHIDKIFEFDQVVEAFEYFQTGKQFGKVIIRVA